MGKEKWGKGEKGKRGKGEKEKRGKGEKRDVRVKEITHTSLLLVC